MPTLAVDVVARKLSAVSIFCEFRFRFDDCCVSSCTHATLQPQSNDAASATERLIAFAVGTRQRGGPHSCPWCHIPPRGSRETTVSDSFIELTHSRPRHESWTESWRGSVCPIVDFDLLSVFSDEFDILLLCCVVCVVCQCSGSRSWRSENLAHRVTTQTVCDCSCCADCISTQHLAPSAPSFDGQPLHVCFACQQWFD
jgi:hypothetical protein